MLRTIAFPTLRRIAAIAALLACAGLPAGELYKWTDANGVLHYSDSPPPPDTKDSTKVRVEGSITAVVGQEAPEPAKKDDKPAAANKPAEPVTLENTPEGKARFCDQAHNNIEMLQSKFQIADASGKPLDDAARAARLAEAQDAASKYCNSP